MLRCHPCRATAVLQAHVHLLARRIAVLIARSVRGFCVAPLRGRASLLRLAVRFSRILILVAVCPVALVRGVPLVRPGRPSHVAALGLSGDPSTGRWPALSLDILSATCKP